MMSEEVAQTLTDPQRTNEELQLLQSVLEGMLQEALTVEEATEQIRRIGSEMAVVAEWLYDQTAATARSKPVVVFLFLWAMIDILITANRHFPEVWQHLSPETKQEVVVQDTADTLDSVHTVEEIRKLTDHDSTLERLEEKLKKRGVETTRDTSNSPADSTVDPESDSTE